MATHGCIRRIHAELIRSIGIEIDKRHLEAVGMTEIIFADRSPANWPWARHSM
jgi:hypothetical protein